MKNEIQSILFEILKEKFSINDAYLNDEYLNISLLGEPFNLDSVEYTYLFFEIEKVFHITITQNKLVRYGFDTISKIVHVVAELNSNVS